MKCVECEVNLLLRSWSISASNRGFFLSIVSNGVCFKARSNPQFNGAGNIIEVASFKIQTGLYRYKNRSRSPTSLTLTFNRVHNSNVKVVTICLGLWCFCKNKESTSLQHKLIISMNKFLQKGHYYLSLLTVAHSIFYACGYYRRSYTVEAL